MASDRTVSFPCFKDKVIMITGASGNLGSAVAREFAKDKARLVLCGRNAERLCKVTADCIILGVPKENVLQLTGDITEETTIERIFNDVIHRFSTIDVLVNCAGWTAKRSRDDMDSGKLDAMYNIHVKVVWNLIKYAKPHLNNSKGNIVTISSVAAFVSEPAYLCYGAAQSSLNQLVKNFSAELGTCGIRINSVVPGFIKADAISQKTKIFGAVSEDYDEEDAVGYIPQGRFGNALQVAQAVQFLASTSASYCNGSELFVDGGLMQRTPAVKPK